MRLLPTITNALVLYSNTTASGDTTSVDEAPTVAPTAAPTASSEESTTSSDWSVGVGFVIVSLFVLMFLGVSVVMMSAEEPSASTEADSEAPEIKLADADSLNAANLDA